LAARTEIVGAPTVGRRERRVSSAEIRCDEFCDALRHPFALQNPPVSGMIREVLQPISVATGSRPPPVRGLAASTPDERDLGTELPIVLVVDDFADNRELYASTLAEAGYQVVEAENGQEALDFIGRHRPAIVVMDLSMPILDGWEATRRIKCDPETSDIVVVALTGHATNFGLQRAKEAGADAVLTKPCLPADLLAMLRSLTI
jgi:two-component system cell cycle response regulator DivK